MPHRDCAQVPISQLAPRTSARNVLEHASTSIQFTARIVSDPEFSILVLVSSLAVRSANYFIVGVVGASVSVEDFKRLE